MVHDGCNSRISFWAIFCPFTPLTAQKIKNSKKWKKHLDISSFYTSLPKIMIVYAIRFSRYGVWPMQLLFFILGYFLPFYPLTTWKMKISIKWKTHLEISSFYKSVPKIMIICHTVPEIWHVTYVTFIFHFGIFLPFYCPKNQIKIKNSPKNQNFNNKKKLLEISSFYTCVP